MDSVNLLEEFRSSVLRASSILRGVIEISEHVEYVFPLLFLKYVSDVRRNIIADAVWDSDPGAGAQMRRIFSHSLIHSADYYSLLEQHGRFQIGEQLNRTFASIENVCPEEFQDVFSIADFNSPRLGKERERSRLLIMLLESIADVSFAVGELADFGFVSGDFFTIAVETLVAARGKWSRTAPFEISRLIAELVSPRGNDVCYDPYCGASSLLIACALESRRSSARAVEIFGLERSAAMWSVSRITTFVHGISGRNIQLGHAGTAALEGQRGGFSVAVSVPPWGAREGVVLEVSAETRQRFLPSSASKVSSEYASVLHMLSLLSKENGRLAVLVPSGSLTKSGPEHFIRKRLLEENYVDTVIALPPKLLSGTAIPVSILMLRTRRQSSEVLFIDATESPNQVRGQNRMSSDAVGRIVLAYRRFSGIESYSRNVSFDEIAACDFNLRPSHYLEATPDEVNLDVVGIRAQRSELLHKLSELDEEIDLLLKKSGLCGVLER